MQSITSTEELNTAIQMLEAEQAVKGRQLKEQAYGAIEGFKPAGLLKGMISSPFVIENLLIGAVSLASGYFAKKWGWVSFIPSAGS